MSKSKPPVRPSGTMHAIVVARKKMDSIAEHTIPRADEAIEALDRVLATIPPTPEQVAEAAAATESSTADTPTVFVLPVNPDGTPAAQPMGLSYKTDADEDDDDDE